MIASACELVRTEWAGEVKLGNVLCRISETLEQQQGVLLKEQFNHKLKISRHVLTFKSAKQLRSVAAKQACSIF